MALNSTLQYNLHALWPELVLSGGALFSNRWSGKLARRLVRDEQTMRVRIARDELRRLRELTGTIRALADEIAAPVGELAPRLIAEPGCGPLTAANLVGEIAGANRFVTDAKLARAAGIAPISQLRPHRPPPPRPRRQPPDQRRHPPHRRHPRALRPRNPRLHRAHEDRSQDPARRHPLPQAPPHPPNLAAPAAAHPVKEQQTDQPARRRAKSRSA